MDSTSGTTVVVANEVALTSVAPSHAASKELIVIIHCKIEIAENQYLAARPIFTWLVILAVASAFPYPLLAERAKFPASFKLYVNVD